MLKTPAVLVNLAVVAAAYGLSPVSPPAPAAVPATMQSGPKPLPFNPHWHVGWPTSRAVGDFMRKDLDGQFTVGQQTYGVKSQDGKSDCLIRIDPAIDSHSLNPNPAGKTAWYPIARIVNTTDNCVPLALSIGKTDTALWIAKFGGGKHDGEVSIGDAGVVVIAHPGSGHDSWSIGDRWSFKQCGHPGSHNSDDAMIWIGPGLCPHLEKDGHNPALVAQDLSQMLSARTSKGAWDPNPWYPDLWFACGGDCCYSDLGK